MAYLTIFSAPKPFTNPHIATIQRNAIQSWLNLGEEVEVFLVGDEEGLGEVAEEFNIPHFPEVSRNDKGTPLVSSIFKLARDASDSPLLAYVNGDILLMPDFFEVAQEVEEQIEDFLIISRRWDLDVQDKMNFGTNWVPKLKEEVHTRGNLHQPAGSDCFIFPRYHFTFIPDFAIGRAGWDNWMIFHALNQGLSVVDATPSLMIVHQNHDYHHLSGGVSHYDLEETKVNAALAGGMENMYMTLDASHEFVNGQVRPARFTLPRMIRSLERLFYTGKERGWRWVITRRLRRWRRKLA